MKTLYLALCDQLSRIDATTPDEVSNTLIKHIDRYNAQPEFTEGIIPFHLPAVFIEIADVRWESLAAHNQRGKAVIRFHILQYALQDSSHDVYGQEANEQTDALRLWDTLDTIHASLQGFTGGDDTFSWTPFDRIATRSDTRHNILSLDVLEYTTLLNDSTASPLIDTGPMPPIKIKGKIVNPLTPPPPYTPGVNEFRL